MSILVVAEHDNSALNSATLNTIAAAVAIGGDIDILVAGSGSVAVAEAASQVPGVSKVMHADAAVFEHQLAENMANLVIPLAPNYSHVLAPASGFGKNFMPRVAAKLDVMQVSDVSEVVDANTFVRPIYAGNALQTVKSNDAIKLITVRTTSFDAVEAGGGSAAIETIDAGDAYDKTEFVSAETTQSERPDLVSARVVISGGRGMGSADNFALIDAVAEKLGAAVGASRAAVDAGYAPNDFQVGQTGKVVAPDLYIAVGISGAIQHLAGMKESKVIVAINKDEEAPIFNVADYGLVADLFDILPEMAEQL